MKTLVSIVCQALALTAFAWLASAQTASVAATQKDLVTAYLAIHEKLAGDSAEELASSTNLLAAAARDLAEKEEDTEELEAIAGAAERMEGTDIAALRTAFAPVSRAMAAYATDAGLELGLFYCPMKDAYWLQGDDQIRNPYHGNSMLTCGQKAEEVKEQ